MTDFRELARRAKVLQREHIAEGCAYAKQGEPQKCEAYGQLCEIERAAETLARTCPPSMMKILEECVRL